MHQLTNLELKWRPLHDMVCSMDLLHVCVRWGWEGKGRWGGKGKLEMKRWVARGEKGREEREWKGEGKGNVTHSSFANLRALGVDVIVTCKIILSFYS